MFYIITCTSIVQYTLDENVTGASPVFWFGGRTSNKISIGVVSHSGLGEDIQQKFTQQRLLKNLYIIRKKI